MSTPFQDISILLAADVASVRAAVKRALIDAGYRVRSAAGGDEAATKAVEEPPDLVITVPDLPHIRGAELLEIARQAQTGRQVAGLFLVPAGDTRPLPLGALQSALRLPLRTSALLESVESLLALLTQTGPPSLEVPVLPPPTPSQRVLEPKPAAPPTDAGEADDEMQVEEVDPETIEIPTEVGRLVESGAFSERSLATILVSARARDLIGHLVLESGDVEKRIHLLHGRPVFCESNLVVETLGEMLVQEKAITPDQLRTSHERMIESGERQGDALVALGAIDRETLAAALKRHVREKLVSAFAWDDATWRLEEADPELVRVLDPDLEPLWLIAEGVRRYTEPARLLTFFDENRARYPVPSGGLAREAAALSALPGGARLPKVLDGCATLSEVQVASGLDELLFTQLMMALSSAGLVTFETMASESPIEIGSGDDLIFAGVDLPGPPRRPATQDAGPAKPPPPPAPVAPVDPALREDIFAIYTRLPHADPFELLEVDADVDEAALGRAFTDWAARVGPDRTAEIQDESLATLARAVWLRISEAYAALKDAEGRVRWRAERARREGGAPARTRWLDADRAFTAGQEHLTASRPAEALEAFRAAGTLNKREPVYRLHAAWAAWLMARDAGDTAAMAAEERIAREAVEAIPILDQGWVFLGEMARARDDVEGARDCFSRALLFNPASSAAQAALDAL